MIGTLEIKIQQLKRGWFQVGNGDEHIFIMGSCRSVPYLNYLNDISHKDNKAFGRFTLYFIDPFNFNWDINDNRVDYHEGLSKQEQNGDLKLILSRCKIFIHEYYANAGMFCADDKFEKNIFQFGLKPEINICIPNFNDVFLLVRDIVNFDSQIRKAAIADYNVTGKLSTQTIIRIAEIRENNLQRFYAGCRLSSFPEFAQVFEFWYKKERMFWTYNHVAKGFTIRMFISICTKLGIDPGNISQEDMYANNYTYLSEYDEGYTWNEEIKPLRDSL